MSKKESATITVATSVRDLHGRTTHTHHGPVAFDENGRAEVDQETADTLMSLSGFFDPDAPPPVVEAPAPAIASPPSLAPNAPVTLEDLQRLAGAFNHEVVPIRPHGQPNVQQTNVMPPQDQWEVEDVVRWCADRNLVVRRKEDVAGEESWDNEEPSEPDQDEGADQEEKSEEPEKPKAEPHHGAAHTTSHAGETVAQRKARVAAEKAKAGK